MEKNNKMGVDISVIIPAHNEEKAACILTRSAVLTKRLLGWRTMNSSGKGLKGNEGKRLIGKVN